MGWVCCGLRLGLMAVEWLLSLLLVLGIAICSLLLVCVVGIVLFVAFVQVGWCSGGCCAIGLGCCVLC